MNLTLWKIYREGTSIGGSKMETDPEKVVAEGFAAWNTHDADKVVAAFAGDSVYEDIPVKAVMKTRKEVADAARWLFGGVSDRQATCVFPVFFTEPGAVPFRQKPQATVYRLW
jgi:hypothetical protein